MLDIECFTYLNRALESAISPIVVLASNRGNCHIRGTEDIIAAHGIPPDLLARILIIPTVLYTPDEVRTIVQLRARTENLNISASAIDKIAESGTKISLRYALQLLTPASILAKVNRKQEIDNDDIAECEDLFIDAKRSAQIVARSSDFLA